MNRLFYGDNLDAMREHFGGPSPIPPASSERSEQGSLL